MESGKIKIWHSIVTRFGLFFIGLLLLATFVSGFMIYKKASAIIASFSQQRIAHSANLAEQSFHSLLKEVENDISVISENAKIQAFANAPSLESQKDIEHLFYVTLKNKPDYFQIRLLSLTDQGQELIRLDKNEQAVIQTPDAKLQNKADRPYFQAALKLQPDEFYFSPISLNEEFGVVSPSLTPTIRAVSLIYNSQLQPTHVVVINVNLKNFYKNLRSIMTSGLELMLIDTDGQYLFASDMTKCFSKQLRSIERFDADFTMPFDSLKSDSTRFETLESKNGVLFISQIKAINYSSNDHQIFLLSFMKENIALSSVLFIKRYSYLIIPIVSVAALLIALTFIHMLALRIGSITRAIGEYDQSSTQAIALPENRKDELGVLARTFNKMKSKIDQQMTELKTALDQEQKAIKEKDEFLQNMSHELRTPLNAILGLTQLVKKNKPKPEQAPIIDAIHRSAQSLAGLMHDILDHQKLMEGQVQLKHKPTKISELLADIHASYRFDAVNKGLDFQLKIDASLKESWYQTDSLRFTQIITNLIVNAIKFTDEGEIALEANLDNPTTLVLKVRDTGRGIRPESLQKIRERFYQEQPHQSTADGFGLGLSIVKQLVDLFAGDLHIESTLNAGSTFTVTLPLIPTHDVPVQNASKTGRLSLEELGANISILHIEDDEPARLLLRQMLESPNVIIEQTNNWAQTLQFLEEKKPNLIISDLMLESVNVSTSLAEIKEKINTPILVLSAMEEEQMQTISQFHLQKPIDLDQLMDLIIVVLGQGSFDRPMLANSYAQYDQDSAKIKKFVSLLVSEFETYLTRINLAFENQDEAEWVAIRHKLITHIRSMELKKLDESLPADLGALDDQLLQRIKQMLLFNLSYFRNELRLL